LSPDPLTPPAGALWANNPYDYANNNPLTLTDPLGTHPVTDDQLALLTHPIGTLAHYVANSVSTLVHHITDPISHWWATHKDRILSRDFLIGAGLVIGGIAPAAPRRRGGTFRVNEGRATSGGGIDGLAAGTPNLVHAERARRI